MSGKINALYIRLSVEDAKTESMSIANQRIALRKFAETLKVESECEIREFVDNGYSGTNFERPAVQELLELVRRNEVNCIIVKDFSRFGRNIIEMGYFIEKVFPVYRTRFISIQDEFDTLKYKGDTGGMEIAFKYLINEYYCRDLSEKSKTAKYAKMRRGEYQSEICNYGYKKGSNGRLEIDGETAPTVKLIFELALQNKTAHEITQILYDKGIPTPGEYKVGKRKSRHDVSRSHHIWQRSAVLRILNDERYTGVYIIGKRSVVEIGSSRNRLKDESEWIKIPDHHPAIIDKELYEQVQAKLIHFKLSKKKPNEYPLKSKVVCGCCGHVMNRLNRKSPVFACRFTRVDKTFNCHRFELAEAELEGLLFEIISKQAKAIANIDNVNLANELDLHIEQRIEYEKRIQACDCNKRSLYEQYLRKEITTEQYKELKADYDTELSDLKRIYFNLSVKAKQMQTQSETQSKLLKMSADIAKEHSLTQALADALIDKVYVYSDNRIEVVWKIKDFAA